MSSHLVVITGSSRGIGAGIATAAASAGVRITACNRTATGVADELVADLAEPSSWSAFAAWLDSLVDAENPERLTVIHNAAMINPVGFAGEVDADDYERNILLNSAAPQALGDAVIRTATRTNLPTVLVQLSSGAGKNPYPGWSSYCASKAAVDMWVRTVGVEQADRADLVRALALAPGVVDTGMQEQIRSSDVGGFPNLERFQSLHADGNLADAGEVGAAIWSISQQTNWDNGTVGGLELLG